MPTVPSTCLIPSIHLSLLRIPLLINICVLPDSPSSAFFQHVDVTKYDSQVSLFTAARSLVPRVDYVFVNAGISDDGMLLHPDNQPRGTFVPPNIAVLDVNLNGAVYSTTLAVQLLRDQEVVNGWRGKIVVTASLA